jgi:hypothetical protein
MSRKTSEAYQRFRMLRLHGLGYSDHDDGGSGKTAEESVSTPLHGLRVYPSCRQLGKQEKERPRKDGSESGVEYDLRLCWWNRLTSGRLRNSRAGSASQQCRRTTVTYSQMGLFNTLPMRD